MIVQHIEVLVEELSMEQALHLLLPKILSQDISFSIYPYQCKQELLQRLPERLRGYATGLPENWRILVVIDRDDDDCIALKTELENFAKQAGLLSRSQAKNQPYKIVNRLAIEELEAWFFGDWEAVRKAYPKAPRQIPLQAKYRDSDAILGGTWEAFERVLQKAGYFKGGLRKIEAARAIAQHMNPACNQSGSFQMLRNVLLEMQIAGLTHPHRNWTGAALLKMS